ncbi:MAG: hypothetical protein GY861_01165 [bacterium]|nr:hypothetical protein [bacterium]
MKTYGVMIPIAGHCFVEVEAESEEQAKSKAFEKISLDDIDDWEPLEQFNTGSVCHCPTPREIEIDEL